MNNTIIYCDSAIYDNHFKKIVIRLRDQYHKLIFLHLDHVKIEYEKNNTIKIICKKEEKKKFDCFHSINHHIENFIYYDDNDNFFIYADLFKEKDKYIFFDSHECKLLISHIECDDNFHRLKLYILPV